MIQFSDILTYSVTKETVIFIVAHLLSDYTVQMRWFLLFFFKNVV